MKQADIVKLLTDMRYDQGSHLVSYHLDVLEMKKVIALCVYALKMQHLCADAYKFMHRWQPQNKVAIQLKTILDDMKEEK